MGSSEWLEYRGVGQASGGEVRMGAMARSPRLSVPSKGAWTQQYAAAEKF